MLQEGLQQQLLQHVQPLSPPFLMPHAQASTTTARLAAP